MVRLANGPMAQRDLADAIGVSARNVTGLVDGLAETGFVTREHHPSDRRATLVTLTDRGTRTAADLAREHDNLTRPLFQDIPPRRFHEFSQALEHILGMLRKAVAAAPNRSEPR